MGRFKDMLADFKHKPWVAHVLRMQDRFSNRLGNQFAGAITYFSVLALVPVLMFAFAALGFTLTVIRPDLLQQVQDAVTSQISGMGPDLQKNIGALIENFLRNWAGVGIVGLLSALYSAAGWAGNLKGAIRAQTRPDFDMSEGGPNFILEKLVNIVLLLGLLVLIPLTFALANASTTLTGWLVRVMGLEGVAGIEVGLRLVGPIGSAVAGWVLFMYVLSVFPEKRFPFRVKAWAAVIGSVGLAILQYLASFLVSSFLGNPAAALFGPVIVLMLFFNLFARLILYVAAWMATAIQQANPVLLQEFDEPLAQVEESPVTAADVRAAEGRQEREEALAADQADQEDEHRTWGERLRAASGLPIGGPFDKEEHRPDAGKRAGGEPESAEAESHTSGRTAAGAGRPGLEVPAGRSDEAMTSTAMTSTAASAAGTATGTATETATAPDTGAGTASQVSRASAVRNARASLQVGWVTGAVAGVGIGAVLAAVTGFATRFMPGGRDSD
ncbi:membrane protein [Raineyella antarctica]|uniref:Membrane protein n=1 Tax=Raineyella antarctica TaxID=1577474 RepID=A0A1G6GPD8_9ACTN|nr:YhjD/YihY/BrkB family envelope integrity protein [Raineyella antarctica]SDB83799.1 membrane protein [Raineyella antarctica]